MFKTIRLKKEKQMQEEREKLLQTLEKYRNKEKELIDKERVLNKEKEEIEEQIQKIRIRESIANKRSDCEEKEKGLLESINKENQNTVLAIILMFVIIFLCGKVISSVTYEMISENEIESEKVIAENRQEVEVLQKQIASLNSETQGIQLQINHANTQNTQIENEIQQLEDKVLSKQQKVKKENVSSGIILTESNRKEVLDYIASLKRPSLEAWEEVSYEGNIFYQFRQNTFMDFYGNGNGNTNIIYPGAIIKGDSLFQKDYTLVPVNRTGMILTCEGDSATVDKANYEEVAKQLEEYEKTAGKYQNTSYYMKTVSSGEEIDASLGVTVTADNKALHAGGSAKGSISKAYNEEKTNILVVIRQTAYTVTAEPMNSAVDYFAEGTDFGMLGRYEPAYISEVDYGRCISMLVTSSESEETVKKALTAEIAAVIPQAANTEVGASTEATHTKTETNFDAEFHIEIVGGNAESSSLTAMNVESCMEQLASILQEGEDDNAQNLVPISYELRYIKDNSKVPCANTVSSFSVNANLVDVMELSWNGKESNSNVLENGSIKILGNDKGIENGAVVLMPNNTLTVKDGMSDNTVVVVVPKKGEKEIKLMISSNEEKWWGKFKEYVMQTEKGQILVNLADTEALNSYGIGIRRLEVSN